MPVKYVKPQVLDLKLHQELNETWVHDRIAEDPSILGLGDVVLRDRERRHANAGRLDLLLQDTDSLRRYEVEVQLGRTDESHIMRTIEYWDIERKRYPQYDHCAVLVAEEVTSRFLNVISLFNGTIPLIAIQMKAIEVADQVALVFTKVMDEVRRGLVDEDEEVQVVTDRAYWEARATKSSLQVVDQLLVLIREFCPDLELKYNKFYVGLARNGKPHNFVTFTPRKNSVTLEIKLVRNDDLDQSLEAQGLEMLAYDQRWGTYRIRMTKEDLAKHGRYLQDLMRKSHEERRD